MTLLNRPLAMNLVQKNSLYSLYEAKGSAGGILVGANMDIFNMVVGDVLKFSVSVMLTNKANGFVWKLIVVYGPAYDDLKHEFLEELESVMGAWNGPVLIEVILTLLGLPLIKVMECIFIGGLMSLTAGLTSGL